MSADSVESRDNSPDTNEHESLEKRTSRKRKVLSCYACRERKMKCDRVYPVCGRCQKVGRAHQCTYDPRLIQDLPVNGHGHADGDPSISIASGSTQTVNGNPSPSTIPSEALVMQIRIQEQRIHDLERRLAQSTADNRENASISEPLHVPHFDGRADEPKIREEIMFRGRGFKTQFYGSTSPYSVVTQFSELQAFCRVVLFANPSTTRIRTNFRNVRNRRKVLQQEKGMQMQGTDDDIIALLPEKTVVDAAVTLYFQMFENTYRILHEPSFRRDYHQFWTSQTERTKLPTFATILLLIVAATSCLAPAQETKFIGDTSVGRDLASRLIEACDGWIMRHSRKHLTLAFFQIQCLSLVVKRVNCVKLKQDWVSSGDVMRLAIAAGMHRNASLLDFGQMSEYDKEMRRRLWGTIMELELQSSLDSGLQSSLCSLHFDVQPAANIPDDAFSTDSEQMAAARPREHFTSTSYLACSIESLPLRVHLVQLLNNLTTNLQYSDVLRYDHQITSLLSALPSWEDSQAAVSLALLDVQLRQYLLILHRPYAKLAAKNPRFNYSFTACLNAANAIISRHDDLLNQGIFILNHLRNDVLRAVITLSQVIYFNSSLSTLGSSAPAANGLGPPPTICPMSFIAMFVPTDKSKCQPPSGQLQIPNLPQNDLIKTTLCTTGLEIMNRARSMFEQKVMSVGTGYMEYWLICVATSIMPSPSSAPSTPVSSDADIMQARGRKACTTMVDLCARVLAMQKDPSNEFSNSLRTTLSTSDLCSSLPNPEATPHVSGTDGTLPPLLSGAAGLPQSLTDLVDPMTGMPTAFLNDGLLTMDADFDSWTFPDYWTFDLTANF